MAPDPPEELEAHDRWAYAHAAMRHDLRDELTALITHEQLDRLTWQRTFEYRMTSLERWQQRLVGASGMLGLLVLGFGAVLVVKFWP